MCLPEDVIDRTQAEAGSFLHRLSFHAQPQKIRQNRARLEVLIQYRQDGSEDRFATLLDEVRQPLLFRA